MMVSPTSRLGSKLGQLFAGLVVAMVLFSFGQWALWLYRSNLPVSNIFTASVAVPDFYSGDNPLVTYDREIKESFLGDFTVEVKGITTNTSECTGGLPGVAYDKGELTDPKITTLRWYVVPHTGKGPCLENLKPGQYYLETNYTIRVRDWPERYLRTTSNVFNVLGKQ